MATYIANNNFDAIEQVGVENVVQVVIDNGIKKRKKVQGTLQNFESKYLPLHITYNGYTTHGLDLVLENIGNLEWVNKIVK